MVRWRMEKEREMAETQGQNRQVDRYWSARDALGRAKKLVKQAKERLGLNEPHTLALTTAALLAVEAAFDDANDEFEICKREQAAE